MNAPATQTAAQIADAAIATLLIEHKVSYSVRYVGETTRDRDAKTGKGWDCDHWQATFTHANGHFTEDYFTGLGLRKAIHGGRPVNGKPAAPSAASVMCSLLLDASACDESFSDWCDNYGYDSDSIKALRTYQDCCDIGVRLRKLFDSATRERMQEILQDY